VAWQHGPGYEAPLSQIIKGYRFRIYPSVEQTARLIRWYDAQRFLWNLALEQRLMYLARPKCERRYISVFDQLKELTDLRAELPWLADVPRHACTQLLIDLDKAWQLCFKGVFRAPNWKRKNQNNVSVCETDSRNWKVVESSSSLVFPKLRNLRAVVHRPLKGIPKTCTITRDGDQWFASIICVIDRDEPVSRTSPVVAIDRGVVNFIATSDGELVPNPRYRQVSSKRLARAQGDVSRKKKGSNNQKKAKIHLARIHRQVRRQRVHFLHTLSTDIANNHGTVVVEKLNVAGMVKSVGSIADAGWSRFAWMLQYKLAWSGGRLIEVPAAFSSQTCSQCGHVDAESRTSQADFCCTFCGYQDHADINAAKVLKTRASRSGLLGEGSPSGALRTKKRVKLRVPRNRPESIAV
jgi:putative transposase